MLLLLLIAPMLCSLNCKKITKIMAKIIFMGTSSFALPTLYNLLQNKQHQIIAVYTKPPQIAGRGQKINLSAVHQVALNHNLPVFTQNNFTKTETILKFASLVADIAVVIAYGLLLPPAILQATKFGCFNLHPSSLPKFRGAAPIQRTIMNQEKNLDVCIIKMNAGLDSGDIASKKNIIIANQTYQEVADKSSQIGAELFLELLPKIEQGSVLYQVQNHQLATYAKKINKDECLLDFSQTGEQLIAKILALSGCLGAYFYHQQHLIKILSASFLKQQPNHKIGEVLPNFNICCVNGYIQPKIVQKSGKKPVNISDFLLGYRSNCD